ncbi:MAG: DHHA1 domain-containing protein [Candidatus Saccharibacteria bacterium]|nr:DHHA1 domain-containing protein [Candidatus Saccharibacteria bacterium]
MTDLFRRLLEARGLDESFLRPEYEDLDDAFELPEMERAVERLKLAADRDEKVIVYGDYDVDGVTASTEMAEILELLGVKSSNLEIMLPNRFTDGYGMSAKLVERAVKTGVKLVVTVDCGSNNSEIIADLSKNSIDVVVTDHHEISGELPKVFDGKKQGEPGGLVVAVNPKREDFRKKVLARQAEILDLKEQNATDLPKDISGLMELCGAGVAFMVARACVKKGWIKPGREKWLLDLAMIGTICDAMKLTGDNRIICHYGMIVLEKGARKGLKELMRVAKIGKIDTDAVGFQLGPRLNAAGRMETADLALRLLRTKSGAEAAKMALELNSLNSERRKQQEEATKVIAERGVGTDQVLVVEGAWHEGVLGIIAGRLVETYKRPCFVLSTENGKGSGRSFGEFNLALALKECQDCLEKGGGHAEACGLKVKTGRVDDFRKTVNRYYDSLKLRNQERFLRRRADLRLEDFDELTLDFMDDLTELEPFGTGNTEPIFLMERAILMDSRRMGSDGQHLRLVIRDKNGTLFKLVAFNAPEEWNISEPGLAINVWLTAVTNTWNGDTTVEGRIVQLELAEDF